MNEPRRSGEFNALDRLVARLSKLPGLGKKSAGRIAYYILERESDFARELAR